MSRRCMCLCGIRRRGTVGEGQSWSSRGLDVPVLVARSALHVVRLTLPMPIVVCRLSAQTGYSSCIVFTGALASRHCSVAFCVFWGLYVGDRTEIGCRGPSGSCIGWQHTVRHACLAARSGFLPLEVRLSSLRRSLRLMFMGHLVALLRLLLLEQGCLLDVFLSVFTGALAAWLRLRFHNYLCFYGGLFLLGIVLRGICPAALSPLRGGPKDASSLASRTRRAYDATHSTLTEAQHAALVSGTTDAEAH